MSNSAVTEQRVVRRIGVPGEGMWLDVNDVWNFEDETSYALDSASQIPVPLDAPSHPQQQQKSLPS